MLELILQVQRGNWRGLRNFLVITILLFHRFSVLFLFLSTFCATANKLDYNKTLKHIQFDLS